MIATSAFPLSCKSLAFTLVHLTPLEFHGDVQLCSQRKLLECMLMDNIRVSFSIFFQVFSYLSLASLSFFYTFFVRAPITH